MIASNNEMPVFALDETSEWEDLENSLAASVEYQSRVKGKFFPIFLFAPMCEPANPDAWEPLKVLPDDLLIVCIARSWDALVLKTLSHAAPVVGEVYRAASCPTVQIDFDVEIAAAYEQMEKADITAFARTQSGEDDLSFFLLRGHDAVVAFDRSLREVTAKGASD